tara:strand:- start:144 stop:1937 length:1794 start_codon:yes stop_codon:yes gene_type:complete
MLLHKSELSEVRLNLQQTEVKKSAGRNQKAIDCLKREFTALSDLTRRGLNFGLISRDETDMSLTLQRQGTHDLSDIGIDLNLREYFLMLQKLALTIESIHDAGYVHRDIKTGNVLMKKTASEHIFANVIDFGLCLRINRKQIDSAAAGGTRVFAHSSQFNKDFAAHPGQDWYSFAMVALTLLEDTPLAIEARLKSTQGGLDFSHIDWSNQFSTPKTTTYISQLADLIRSATELTAEDLPDFTELIRCAEALMTSIKTMALQFKLSNYKSIHRAEEVRLLDLPVRTSTSGIKAHDVLIIIDETGSIASQMVQLKQVLQDSMDTFTNRLNLRVDLWAVRDYGRGSNQAEPTVRKIGYRLVGETLKEAVDDLRADATQHDFAEAYEMAFEQAYKGAKQCKAEWLPRKNSKRTVILAGDAYAHGWLRKPWLPFFFADIKKSRGDDLERNTHLKTKFTELHPSAFNRNDEDRQERDSLIAVQKEQKLDDYGNQEQDVPGRGGRIQKRPNLQRAVERLRDYQSCSVNTIGLSSDVVSEYYMKFTAMLGDGVFMGGNDNIGQKLVGILALADEKLLANLQSNWQQSGNQQAVADTQVLNTSLGF